MERTFAYGADEYNGYKSPATEAGYSTIENPILSRVEGKYDEICLPEDVKPHTPDSKGVITESVAEMNWEEVIEYYDQFSKTKKEESEWAHKIAEELGWE